MKKLSQKEILDEGFGSMMKSLARGAAGLAKGTAKMISPTAARVAKDAADKVGAAIGNVLSSPTAAVKDYFNRPEVRSKYDNLKIGKETKLNNFRRQIELEFRDVRKGTQIKTTAEAYRTDEGGTSPETWSFEKIKTADGSSIGPDGDKDSKKADKPADTLGSTPAPVEEPQPEEPPVEEPTVEEPPVEEPPVEEPQPEEPAVEEPPVEEPTVEEPPVEEPPVEEPQPTVPTRDDVEAAITAANLNGFERATEDKLAIKKIRDYLKTKSPRNAPGLTWAEYLRSKRRGTRGPTIDGREIPIVAAREIVAESKKSQKSLLKHLQSMSR
jgi:hypothetical protein